MRKTTTTTYKYDENGKLIEMTVRVEEDVYYYPQPYQPIPWYQVYTSSGSSDITYKTYNQVSSNGASL